MVLRPFWMPNLIGWCFRLTLQMFLTLSPVRPFSKNFEQQGGSCPNFSICLLFLWFFCTSIIILPQGPCQLFFCLWAHDKATLQQGLFLPLLIFAFCIIFQGFFPWCLFPSLANDTYILNLSHVVSFTFDQFASQLVFVGLFIQPHKCSIWASFGLPLGFVLNALLVASKSLVSLLVLPPFFYNFYRRLQAKMFDMQKCFPN